MMGSPRIVSILRLSCFLLLFLSPGFGAEVVGAVEHAVSVNLVKESAGKSRKLMIDVMDYADPGPNTNPRSGFLNPPPPPPG